MATFLFNEIIFGPVKSRRLGVSLGINLLPVNRKICNFDCIYCECGLNTNDNNKPQLPSRTEVYNLLAQKLSLMCNDKIFPDVITFAGNGEPTLHPEFDEIINDTIKLRNIHCPSAAISVLSNATMLHKPNIVCALKKVDQNILKLDSGLKNTILQLNRPNKEPNIKTIIEQFRQFEGKLIIQSMFVKGEANGINVDNTSEKDINTWLSCISKIKPQKVMIYTIDRDTPFGGLKKVPIDELKAIADKVTRLGILSQVSG